LTQETNDKMTHIFLPTPNIQSVSRTTRQYVNWR